MITVRKIKRALRGDFAAKAMAFEVFRRCRVALTRGRNLQVSQRARLRSPYAEMAAGELVAHFRRRSQPVFLPGYSFEAKLPEDSAPLQSTPATPVLVQAERIVNEHVWPLMGLGNKNFGDPINWNRDPLSGIDWPLEYHADLKLLRGDGSDVRVLWELNRLPHLLTLAEAYSVTRDESLANEFFQQVSNWRSQNPCGYGANWACAMEVALRATNVLGAFEVFRHSALLNEHNLAELLALFDQHGSFVRDHLEFSYLDTSNHYLSDVVGLLWLGIILPELEAAAEWRAFGLQEMLREMDKQVLADGADFEASTGYHRFVLELFLYTFILCRANEIEIEPSYWVKLRGMLSYVRAYLRPDGRAPLIGDTDSGQVFPIRRRDADDHAYLLGLGAVLFEDASLLPADLPMPEEVLWILGEEGVSKYQELKAIASTAGSVAFPNAGIYVLRADDLFLIFNASGSGIGGRGSHGHNDALSIEVSACGTAFIIDPGSYVYTADLRERHLFRSTAYHSTVQIDDVEQNTTDEQTPFVIGNEAHPRVLNWETDAEFDSVTAEHDGYRRLRQPVTHRRSVRFEKRNRFWLLEDEFTGAGTHQFSTRFHFNASVEVGLYNEKSVMARDAKRRARVLIQPLDLHKPAEFEQQFVSRDYGSKQPSMAACWSIQTAVPLKLRWLLIPIHPGENEDARLAVAEKLVT